MEKTCPEKKRNLPSRVHLRKRLWSLSDCLGALPRLTQLSEPKCLYGEKLGPKKLVQPGGWPYHHHHKRLTQPSHLTNFSSLANGSPPFGRKCIKRWFPRVARLGRWFFYLGQLLSAYHLMKNPIIPGKIQMERFIQVRISGKKKISLSRYYIFLVFTQTTEIFCTICLVNQF